MQPVLSSRMALASSMQKRPARRFLAALNELQKSFFACYLEKGGDDLNIAHARSALYTAVNDLKKKYHGRDFSGPERLYESIFLLSLLRFRVRDRALFEVCRDELNALKEVISGLLSAPSHEKAVHALADFDRVTEAFRALYDSVLCITAREPEVFEFLFAHLAAFRREIAGCMEDALLAVDA